MSPLYGEPAAFSETVLSAKTQKQITVLTVLHGCCIKQKFVFCFTICILSILFADGVSIDLFPHTRECFYLKTTVVDSELVGSFQTFYGDGSIRVTVEGPILSPRHRQATVQNPIFTSVSENTIMKVPLPSIAQYGVCIRNLLSFDQTITIDFHAVDKTSAVLPNQLAMEDEAMKLRGITAKVLEKANSLFEQQSHAMVRLGVHEQLGQSTRQRATFWKSIQMVVQLMLTGLHMYSVKSYFEVKTIV